MKKLLALALVACMLLLAACTGTTTTTPAAATAAPASSAASAPAQSAPSAPAAAPEAPASEGGPYELPLTDKPVTLSMFIGLDAKASVSISSLAENRAMQYYEEISGVKIDWQHPSSATSGSEALNVMIASGDLTDLISGINNASDGLDALIDNNVILDLSDYIVKDGYYLNGLFTEYPEFYAQVLTYNGKIGCMPSCRLAESTRYFESYIIREDWVNKLGLQMPTNKDEWYDVLTAFKTGDPNGNGEADELPFVSNSTEEMGITRLSPMWGVNANFYKWNATEILDGKITFATDCPGFAEYVTDMNKWYAEGLIDPEYLSTDATSWKEKILNDKGGAFYGKMNGGIGTLIGSYDFSKNADFSLTPVGYGVLEDGKSYDCYSQDIYDNGGVAVSTACKDPDLAVKWYDYFYSPDGQILASFGVEGETYTKDENGVPHYTELITKAEGLSQVQAIAKYTIGGIGPRPVNDEYYWDAVMSTEQQRRVYPTVSVSSTERKVPGSLKYSMEDEARLTSLMGDIGTYYKETLHAFIMGTKPLEELDSLGETLRGMGLDEAIALMQKAYDAYLASQVH